MQCKAKRRLTNERCKQRVTPGREVCYFHGGKTPRGVAASRFVHGRYSLDIPTRLEARYLEAIQDPNLLVLRDEVALLDARLSDLIKRVDTGEAGDLWGQLRRAWGDFADARAARDTDGMDDALGRLEPLILRGLADYAAWGEIARVIEQRRRLVESERKRLLELQQFVTVEKLMVFMGQIQGIILQRVSDPEIRQEISEDIAHLQLREG